MARLFKAKVQRDDHPAHTDVTLPSASPERDGAKGKEECAGARFG